VRNLLWCCMYAALVSDTLVLCTEPCKCLHVSPGGYQSRCYACKRLAWHHPLRCSPCSMSTAREHVCKTTQDTQVICLALDNTLGSTETETVHIVQCMQRNRLNPHYAHCKETVAGRSKRTEILTPTWQAAKVASP
jgi:hypothetical protein